MLERIEAGRITEGRLLDRAFPEQADHDATLPAPLQSEVE